MEEEQILDVVVKKPIMVPIGSLQGTMRCKREVYLFMCLDCKAYLDDEKNITIYFLKQLMSSERKCKSIHFHLILL
jgi:hypothetical protein